MLSHTSCSYFYSEFEYVFTWSGIPLNFFKYVPSKNFHITGKYLITKKRKRLQRQDWRDLSHFSRSSRPEVFLRKVVLKICSKFTGDHPCRKAISIKSNVTKQRYWNRTSARVFSCKFAVYFQNTFS